MTKQKVRVGIVGAGANTRLRHIPGFRAIEGVELAGVVNRTPESTAQAAQEFGISKEYPHWQALIEDPDLDAVMIGTWPNLHCQITCAALEAGKHVLTEARMSCNAGEAHRMLRAAQAHPELVAQVVPSPFGLKQHETVCGMIEDGFLREFRELVVLGANDAFWDNSKMLHWRQDANVSGLNVLSMGILHETAARWTPPTTRVFAQSGIHEKTRPSAIGEGSADVTTPDNVQIVTEFEGGARGLYHLSGVALFGPGLQIHIYGSHGTIKLEIGPRERLLIGRVGESELRELDIPKEKRGGWRVEEEFIGAIRGEETVQLTDFAAGAAYMEFTEAVARSSATNQPVDLPLTGISE